MTSYFLYITAPLPQLHKTSDCSHLLPALAAVLRVQLSGNFVISYFVVTLSTRLLQNKERIQTVFNVRVFSYYIICVRLKIETCKH